jgi:hypothetical protein
MAHVLFTIVVFVWVQWGPTCVALCFCIAPSNITDSDIDIEELVISSSTTIRQINIREYRRGNQKWTTQRNW